jgi:hypothetical protein
MTDKPFPSPASSHIGWHTPPAGPDMRLQSPCACRAISAPIHRHPLVFDRRSPSRNVVAGQPRTNTVSTTLPVTDGDEERDPLTGPTVPYEQPYLSPRIPWRHGR